MAPALAGMVTLAAAGTHAHAYKRLARTPLRYSAWYACVLVLQHRNKILSFSNKYYSDFTAGETETQRYQVTYIWLFMGTGPMFQVLWKHLWMKQISVPLSWGSYYNMGRQRIKNLQANHEISSKMINGKYKNKGQAGWTVLGSPSILS